MADNNAQETTSLDVSTLLETEEGQVVTFNQTLHYLAQMHTLPEIVKYSKRKASTVRNRLFDPTKEHTDLQLATMALKAARGEI